MISGLTFITSILLFFSFCAIYGRFLIYPLIEYVYLNSTLNHIVIYIFIAIFLYINYAIFLFLFHLYINITHDKIVTLYDFGLRISSKGLVQKIPLPPFIVYLRSFKSDEIDKIKRNNKSIASMLNYDNPKLNGPEWILALSLYKYGKVIALGPYGEKLPPVGFDRFYVPNHQWQSTFMNLVNKSNLVCVLISKHFTESFIWELKYLKMKLEPKFLLIFIDKVDSSEWNDFSQKVIDLFHEVFSVYLYPIQNGGVFISFTGNWKLHHISDDPTKNLDDKLKIAINTTAIKQFGKKKNYLPFRFRVYMLSNYFVGVLLLLIFLLEIYNRIWGNNSLFDIFELLAGLQK